MAKSIVMNRISVGGGSSGGEKIRLMHAAELPATVAPRAICAVTEETVSGMLMQVNEPDHIVGLIWIEIADAGGDLIIGADGEEAVELIRAWISTGVDWAPVEAYHSATGGWVQFSTDIPPLPEFTYTGNRTLIDDGGGNWRIKFLTSGSLVFLKKPGRIDVFAVGGGGNAAYGGGAGGGYTKTTKAVEVLTNTNYAIVVGGAAGTSSGFGTSATGGKTPNGNEGGTGGSGGGAYTATVSGAGGSNGGNGGNGGGTGQGTTTREFGEASGTLYAGGGGAGGGGAGGAGGGATGVTGGAAGAANTGGGASGGGGGTARSGGSGIVIIRNARGAA